MTRRRTAEDGAAAVELALVAPLVLGVIGMVMSIALSFAVTTLLQRGAELAARAVAVPVSAYAQDPAVRYRSHADVVAAADRGAVFLDIAPEQVVVDPPAPREGQAFAVRITWTFSNPAAGLVAALTGAEGAGGTATFTATTAGVRE